VRLRRPEVPEIVFWYLLASALDDAAITSIRVLSCSLLWCDWNAVTSADGSSEGELEAASVNITCGADVDIDPFASGQQHDMISVVHHSNDTSTASVSTDSHEPPSNRSALFVAVVLS